MKSEFKLYTQVQLVKPLPKYDFQIGDVAIIVDYANDKQGNKGYILEFFDSNGITLQVLAVPQDTIALPPEHAVVNYRAYKAA